MHIISSGGTLHEMSMPTFWEKYEIYLKMLTADSITQQAER